jgi:60 kDa SS-A/Ro ribonucleoprotein
MCFDAGIAVVLRYLIKGLESTQAEFGKESSGAEFGKESSGEEVSSVLAYLTMVETVRHSSDEHQVARLIEQHHLTIEYVPTALLQSKEVSGLIEQHHHVYICPDGTAST